MTVVSHLATLIFTKANIAKWEKMEHCLLRKASTYDIILSIQIQFCIHFICNYCSIIATFISIKPLGAATVYSSLKLFLPGLLTAVLSSSLNKKNIAY